MKPIQKTQQFIKRNKLVKKNDLVLIGLSGGMDSVCLTHMLKTLQYEFGIHLHAVHINHNLRKSSAKDEAFCKKLAGALNIPFSARKWPKNQQLKKGSLEEHARHFRHQVFFNIAEKINASTIALAHHQNDLAETVLMRIIRGSGLQGIASIQPNRMIEGMQVIRPLLALTRDEIQAHVQEHKLSFVVDESNDDLSFTRNKVRHRLIPFLQNEFNPNIQKTLSNLAENAAADYQHLQINALAVFNKITIKKTRALVEFDIEALQRKSTSMQRQLMRLAIAYLKGNTNQLTLLHIKDIEDLYKDSPKVKMVHLPVGIRILAKQKKLCFSLVN
ncbi:MAG: tRNA lysidine(34) synthetase TilS [Candidatus Omnitrophica bacterium]|nr:tRNA lysidine(34) synthetase TilS [Candidatus Omnitrophota bacterium]